MKNRRALGAEKTELSYGIIKKRLLSARLGLFDDPSVQSKIREGFAKKLGFRNQKPIKKGLKNSP